MQKLFTFLFIISLLACGSPPPGPADLDIPDDFDIQGHRGARGHYPENSIAGFKAAMDMGATTLEMDVVIARGNQVIVSHEPWMSAEICIGPDGSPILTSDEKNHNIYNMTINGVQAYDCGSKGHPDFPDQKKVKVVKPTLAQVVAAVDSHARRNQLPQPNFNIEIKRMHGFDDVFHPEYESFTIFVMHELANLGIEDRSTIQCFDTQVLNLLLQKFQQVKTSFLVRSGEASKNLATLSSHPDIYSPKDHLLDKEEVNFLHEKNITVIPWTVNDRGEMARLIDMGVDGIITDYPDRLADLVEVSRQGEND